METSTRHVAALVGLVALTGALAACGDDSPRAEPSAPRTSASSTAPASSAPTSPAASPTATASSPAATEQVLRLALAPVVGKCKMPTPADLSRLQHPFRGTVTSVSAGQVTVEVTQHFDDATFTSATLAHLGSDTGISDVAVDFAPGEEVLIASSEGQVATCGLSGAVTPDLEQLYSRAFD